MDDLGAVLIRLIRDDPSPIDPAAEAATLFLRGAFNLNWRLVAGMMKRTEISKDLGRLWSDLKPIGGVFRFELATVLPYHLPRLQGKAEYVQSVGGSDLVVCQRMVRCFYGPGHPSTDELDYVLMHVNFINHIDPKFLAEGTHVLPLKTFVVRRFEVPAATAAEAIESNFVSWRSEFVGQIARLVEALRSANPLAGRHMLPIGGVSSFPLFWVAVESDGHLPVIQHFVGDGQSAAFRALQSLTGEETQAARAFLAGERTPTVSESALGLARAFLHHGYPDLSVVQVCVAAEATLAHRFREHVLEHGASANKLKEYGNDVTFSELLNLHVFSFSDIKTLDGHQELIGHLNWARKRRNDLVHGNERGVLDSQKVQEAIDAATKLIGFLDGTSRVAAPPATPGATAP